MKFINEEMIKVLNNGKNIAISAHVNPDGDAVGSCFALALSLKKMGKNPIVLLEGYNQKFKILPGKEFLFKGDINSLEVDIFVCLDCSDPERLGDTSFLFNKTEKTICVDHHKTSVGSAKYNYINDKASSTCEMIFELVNNIILIDKDIASCLYAGLVSDTGGFRHSNTTPQTFKIATKLLELEIPFNAIYNEIMYIHSLTEAKIFAKAINRLEILNNLPVAYTYIDLEDLNKIGADKNNLDGIVEYSLNTRGVQVSIFIYQLPENLYKVSLRSKKADISGICAKFGGGGHKLAGGFSLSKPREEILKEIIPLIEEVLK